MEPTVDLYIGVFFMMGFMLKKKKKVPSLLLCGKGDGMLGDGMLLAW